MSPSDDFTRYCANCGKPTGKSSRAYCSAKCRDSKKRSAAKQLPDNVGGYRGRLYGFIDSIIEFFAPKGGSVDGGDGGVSDGGSD